MGEGGCSIAPVSKFSRIIIMAMTLQRDAASLVSAKIASAFAVATAAGSGDNTAATGVTIDRFAAGSIPLNGTLVIAWQATLASAQTLTIKNVAIEHSADGSSWSTLKSFTDPGVVATGAGTAVKGQVELGVDLSSAKRYIRANHTPDLSASGTDSSVSLAVLVLAGFDRLPA
jgi:hypothetical protein